MTMDLYCLFYLHYGSSEIFHSLWSVFFVARVNRVKILNLQFMKERRQKEETHRSAVSGKKIKLKIKKSSKDKEVDIYLLYFFQQSRRSVGNFNSHFRATCIHQGEKGLGTKSLLAFMKYQRAQKLRCYLVIRE